MASGPGEGAEDEMRRALSKPTRSLKTSPALDNEESTQPVSVVVIFDVKKDKEEELLGALRKLVKHAHADPEVCPQYVLNKAYKSQSGYNCSGEEDTITYFLTEIWRSEDDRSAHMQDPVIEILAKTVFGISKITYAVGMPT